MLHLSTLYLHRSATLEELGCGKATKLHGLTCFHEGLFHFWTVNSLHVEFSCYNLPMQKLPIKSVIKPEGQNHLYHSKTWVVNTYVKEERTSLTQDTELMSVCCHIFSGVRQQRRSWVSILGEVCVSVWCCCVLVMWRLTLAQPQASTHVWNVERRWETTTQALSAQGVKGGPMQHVEEFNFPQWVFPTELTWVCERALELSCLSGRLALL